MEGTVKWFNPRKNFGFIKGDDEKDYFVHHTFLKRGTILFPEDRVSFEPSEGERGLQAKDVTLLKKASEMGKSKRTKKVVKVEDTEELEENEE